MEPLGWRRGLIKIDAITCLICLPCGRMSAEEALRKNSHVVTTWSGRFEPVVMAGLLVGLFARPAVAVMFPDKNLEAALRALVFEKKNNADELTDDDLRKISTLEAEAGRFRTSLAWRSAPTCCYSTCRTTRSAICRRSKG